MVDFPEDTLYNIFSRIPIKSLARFWCVCKQWREYINDPHLAKIHVKEEPKLMHIVPIKYSTPSQPAVSVLSFLRVTEDTTDEVQVETDLSFRLTPETYSIKGYCNGHITLVKSKHYLDHPSTTFVVINPLTKECHELPPMMEPFRIGQGLGFDNSTNAFKMVCVMGICTMVHVLGTDSWREIPLVPCYHIGGEAVYANGRLYWFALTSYSIVSQLVWLDMKKEEFGVTDLPKRPEVGYRNKLVDLNGEVGFVYHISGSNEKVVWILKHEEWMLHCVTDQSVCHFYSSWVVLGCWNKDGDILIEEWKPCTPKSRLVVYRLKSDSFHSLISPEDEEDENRAEVRMYQSSLLSIRKWH